jgi:hypothetical protein
VILDTIDPLALVEERLAGLPGRLYFQAPSDFLRRLPALIVEQAPPQVFSGNSPHARYGVVSVLTLNAIAGERAAAAALCQEALRMLEDSVHRVTDTGWISRVTVSTVPHLAAHKYEKSSIFQYSTAVEIVCRAKSPANE